MTVTECLTKINELTAQNLQILKTINSSFYTQKSHLVADIAGERFTIPSFLSLENKVNHLQDSFNSLVKSAQTGGAWYNIDGNSKEIQVLNYQSAPCPLNVQSPKGFDVEEPSFFKDMLTPSPYINIDLSDVPDDISQVNVKKITPYDSQLVSSLKAAVKNGKVSYIDIHSIIEAGDPGTGRVYIKGSDYSEYDSLMVLPVRTMTCSGEFVIEEIVSDTIDEDLQNIIELKLRGDLKYLLADGVTKKLLNIDDELTTWDGSAKVVVENVNLATNVVKVRVKSGEYLNLLADNTPGATSDYSVLRFWKASDFNKDKYVHIPLEEDGEVYICVAPVNSRMNTQSRWSECIYIDKNNLRMLPGDPSQPNLSDYYAQNVTNIGDVLMELANIAYKPITGLSQEDFRAMTAADESAWPSAEEPLATIGVYQINKHLNDSDTIKNIRSLYAQKKQYQTDLLEVNNKITSINNSLASVSFDDMSGTRSMYNAQLAELKAQQSEITSSISKLVDSISQSVNNAQVPIEGAKFRIRGYLNVENMISPVKDSTGTIIHWPRGKNISIDDVLGIEVKYRYKNPEVPQANVQVINEFLFTEWNIYAPPIRTRHMSYKDGRYTLSFEDTEGGKIDYSANTNKYNQIDIPINQGESVEMQFRLVYGYGYPYTKTTSEWSPIYTQVFPDELVEDVQVKTIIEENNNDIETNRFSNILSDKGVTKHVDDGYMDQDVQYYHHADTIASGFMTDDRRVIPLGDALLGLRSQLQELQADINGTYAESLEVSVTINGVTNVLQPDIENIVHLAAYTTIQAGPSPTGSYSKASESAPVIGAGLLSIKNVSGRPVKLFSMFPGDPNKLLATFAVKNGVIDTSKLEPIRSVKRTGYNLPSVFDVNDPANETGSISLNGVQCSLIYRPNDLGLSAAQTGTDAHYYIGTPPGGSSDLKPVYEIPGIEGLFLTTDPNSGQNQDTRTDNVKTIPFNLATQPYIVLNEQGGLYHLQTPNQVAYFTNSNIISGQPYDNVIPRPSGASGPTNINAANGQTMVTALGDSGSMTAPACMVLPILNSEQDILVSHDSTNPCKVVNAGDFISFPLRIQYKLDTGTVQVNKAGGGTAALPCDTASWTLGLAVRNSLFKDPVFYQVKFIAKYASSVEDQVSAAKAMVDQGSKYNVVVR